MNIFRLAFELFIIYMVYKLIFDFIIPVYHTTKQMKKKMGEMHEKMQNQQQDQFKSPPEKEVTAKKTYADDYIDYEEIKEV